MTGSVKMSREEIDKATYGVSSLDEAQRRLVRQALYRLHDSGGGTIYRGSCHRELVKLMDAGGLSSIDVRETESALFSE